MPDRPADVFLNPGELWFGGGGMVRTLLGSCVAVTLWHPAARIGGMCHYMTPSRPPGFRSDDELNGRYADEALLILLDAVRAARTSPHDYEIKMFGGGTQFAVPAGSAVDVATWNVEAGLRLLASHGLRLDAMHLGGTGHRQVVLDVDRGDVWMRHVDLTEELVVR